MRITMRAGRPRRFAESIAHQPRPHGSLQLERTMNARVEVKIDLNFGDARTKDHAPDEARELILSAAHEKLRGMGLERFKAQHAQIVSCDVPGVVQDEEDL